MVHQWRDNQAIKLLKKSYKKWDCHNNKELEKITSKNEMQIDGNSNSL